MEKFLGKWTQVKHEKLDEYLSTQGIPWPVRKAAIAAGLTTEITEKDGVFHLHQWNLIKTVMDLSFKMDEVLDWTRPDGKKCKTKFYWDGEKLMQEMLFEDEKVENIVREFVGEQLVQTVTSGDIVCKRFFNKAK